jgi:hypothetical protein
LTTTYSNKVNILGELWLNYRDDDEFTDFIDYNDIGLPVAYAIANDIVISTAIAEQFVNETFILLLNALGVDDVGFETLNDLFEASDN